MLFRSALSIFIICSLMTTVVSSIIGVTAIVAEVFQEWTKVVTKDGEGVSPVISSMALLAILYGIFWNGKHKTFINTLSVMVAIMALCFVGTMLLMVPSPEEIIQGLIPQIPETGSPHLVIGGMVGTTMASVCLISRSTLVKEQGWGVGDLKVEQRDSIISMTLTFLISAAIIVTATGTLHEQGIQVESAVEMLYTLEPLVGKFAISVFAIGILCAGFSSIFPNLVMLPWLINDYKGENKGMQASLFRVIVLIITLTGLIVPVFGGKPIAIMIASQAVSPVVLPVIIASIIYLLNNKKVVGGYKPGLFFQSMLVINFIFSLAMCVISLQGFVKLL